MYNSISYICNAQFLIIKQANNNHDRYDLRVLQTSRLHLGCSIQNKKISLITNSINLNSFTYIIEIIIKSRLQNVNEIFEKVLVFYLLCQ